MDITYLGHSSFKLKGKQTSLVTDPYDADLVGLKFPKTDADIVTLSHEHDDHNKHAVVENVKKIISGPGEYEIAGVSVIGIPSFHDAVKGEERGKNTIYVIEMDGFRICHLGDLGHPLSEAQVEDIGDIHILLIPVGGVYTIDSKVAANVSSDIEPKVIIPMHYLVPGLKEGFAGLETYEPFVKALGLAHEVLPKLSLRDPEFLSEEQKIVILEKRN